MRQGNRKVLNRTAPLSYRHPREGLKILHISKKAVKTTCSKQAKPSTHPGPAVEAIGKNKVFTDRFSVVAGSPSAPRAEADAPAPGKATSLFLPIP